MKSVSVAEVEGLTLDWLVTVAQGITELGQPDNIPLHIEWLAMHEYDFEYSTNWAHGGRIIEENKIGLWAPDGGRAKKQTWAASNRSNAPGAPYSYGPTPLIAAMRCFVRSKLGDTVDVPDEMVSDARL